MAFGIVCAADKGADTAFAIHGYEGGLLNAARSDIAGHDLTDGALSAGLNRQINRGFDHQILGRLANQGADLRINPVDEILCPLAGKGRRHSHGCGKGQIPLFRRDGMGLDHLVEHDGGAAFRARLVRERAIARWALHQSGQEGGFTDRKLGRGLIEIALRRGLDAIGPGPEIDPVQIEREDLFLAELHLQPDGEDQLLHLAPNGLVWGQEQVAGQLLGDGRGSADNPSGAGIVDGGADDTNGVKTGVEIEAAVLDGDEGFGHIGRKLVQIDRGGILRATYRHQPARMVEIGDRRLTLDLKDFGGVRQVRGEHGEEGGKEDQSPNA